MLKNAKRGKVDPKRNALSDLTNSNPLPSSSVSSSSFECGTVGSGIPVSEQISSSIFASRRRTCWNERKKNQKKTVSVSRISNILKKNDDAESLNLSEATPLAVPCRKKQRVVSGKGGELRDFIEKQNAYFKEIDEFTLSEEEVGSIDELD